MSLRKIFDNIVLIELGILHVHVSMQHAILFFPTLNTSKSCFVNNKMVCMLLLFMFKPAKPKRQMRILNQWCLALLEIQITGLSIHSCVKNIIKSIQGKNDTCSIYIYIWGSYLLINQKMNKSKKNYIKIAMPVAKRTAEYASKCCVEGKLSA